MTSLKYRYHEAPKIFNLENWSHWHNVPPVVRLEVLEWLIDNFGGSATDMTDLNWGKSRWFQRIVYVNERGRGTKGGWIKSARSHEFIFYHPDDAVMFKLAWGGQ